MTFSKHYHNILSLLQEPFSVIELAEAGCLPPVLHVNNMALLMHPDSKKLQEAFEVMLKGLANNNILPVITVEEYVKLTIEQEQQRNASDYCQPCPPGQLPPMTMMAVAHQNTELLRDDAEMAPEQRRMFVVHRDDMKKWLESENEWPLPRDNLLSRWWPETPPREMIADGDNTSKVEGENCFHVGKGKWQICFQGNSWLPRWNYKGIQYIAHLIQGAYNDEPEIHVSDLFYLVNGRPSVESSSTELAELTKKRLAENGLSVSGPGNAGDVLTHEGKKLARINLRNLEIRIEKAKERGQTGEALRLREEKEELEDYIRKAFGLSGRPRKLSDTNEGMRKAVSRRIKDALKKMGEQGADELAIYLKDHLTTGLFCSFRKDPKISWKIMKD